MKHRDLPGQMDPFVTEITRYDDLPFDQYHTVFQPPTNSALLWVPFGTSKSHIPAAHLRSINACIAAVEFFQTVNVISMQRLNTGIKSVCGKFENPLRVNDGDTVFVFLKV